MSQERPLEVPANGTQMTATEAQKLSPADVKQLRAERKAKFARILERGVLVDRLAVDLPPNVHGEWCSNDPVEIERLRGLGFEIDTKYAPARRLHDKGTNESIVGDVIHMTCDMETWEILQEIRKEKFQELHGKPNDKGKVGPQIEERQFAASVGDSLPLIQEGDTRATSGAEILNAIKK